MRRRIASPFLRPTGPSLVSARYVASVAELPKHWGLHPYNQDALTLACLKQLSSSPPKYVTSSKISTTSPKQIPSPTSEVVVPSSDPTAIDLATPATTVPRDALSDKARPGGPTTENDDPSHWDTTRLALTHSKKQCATLEADVENGVAQGLKDRVNSNSNVNSSVRVPTTFVKSKLLANLTARHDSPQPKSVQDN